MPICSHSLFPPPAPGTTNLLLVSLVCLFYVFRKVRIQAPSLPRLPSSPCRAHGLMFSPVSGRNDVQMPGI